MSRLREIIRENAAMLSVIVGVVIVLAVPTDYGWMGLVGCLFILYGVLTN
jgi:hypothetical protein